MAGNTLVAKIFYYLFVIYDRKEEPSINDAEEAAVENETAFNSRVEKFKIVVAKRSTLYGGKKVVVEAEKTVALENRKRRIESDLANNNTRTGTGRKKVQKKVPVRKSRDNESDNIADL